MRRVIVNIDSLVLLGFRYEDRHAIAAALREELARTLAAPESAQQVASLGSVPRLKLGSINVGAGFKTAPSRRANRPRGRQGTYSMSSVEAVQSTTTKPVQNNSNALLLQRKCACGGSAGLTGECTDCQSKKLLGKTLQTKLRVNEPGDEYEQEADRVADQVMATPARPAVSSTPPRVQRFSGQSNAQQSAPASVDQALANPGRPLEPALRRDMEQRFGHDFSRVRVHTGDAAEQSARDVNASAYSVGHNMVFGAGGFAPGSHSGRRLLAHELTHVVQQEHVGKLSPVLHRKPATDPRASADKPQIVAIEAVMDANQGTATLSDGRTVPLTLTKNDYPPGTRVLNHVGNGTYEGTEPIVDPKNPKRTSWAFRWINPYLPGTKETSYAWAPTVTVTITVTAEQRIARLPEHIRNVLTTDKGEVAGADEIEEIARAGEALEQAGVSAQDMILYQEQIKAARASGVAITVVDAAEFARSFVGRRAQEQLQGADRLGDIVTISKLLANEPLYMLGSGALGVALNPNSDRRELVVAIGLHRAYADQGRAADLNKLDNRVSANTFTSWRWGFRPFCCASSRRCWSICAHSRTLRSMRPRPAFYLWTSASSAYGRRSFRVRAG